MRYLQSALVAGLRVALCRLTGTSGLSHEDRDVTRICTGSTQSSASAIVLEEVPPLTHCHHLSLYTWWHLLAFFMCQSINIRTVREREIPSSWVGRDAKHLVCTAPGDQAVPQQNPGHRKSRVCVLRLWCRLKKLSGRRLKCFATRNRGEEGKLS